MSEDEKNLRRIQAWDAYNASKTAYLAQKFRLEEYGRIFADISRRIASQPHVLKPSDAEILPEQVSQGIAEYLASIEDFKRAWRTAHEFGWPVDQRYPKELGGI
jgi:hypothetical protein